ncbi:MAG: 3-methyl-2-oxobutanoate hydroxymethyltransferase [Chloroflexi bacterium]|nr:MAG: 3-methyl-2-oxobutanoate hydroxymethyltransferase [Chloroflexota bacterium]
MITAYDYSSGYLAEKAGVDIILIGDSMGQVVFGYDTTLPVSMEDIIRHTQMVVRGTENTHIVSDLPFMSYQVNVDQAVLNAGRLVKEGGCQSVKLEGGASMGAQVKAIVNAGIPVMGHLGLTPQSVNQLGGYRVQSRSKSQIRKIFNDIVELEKAGAFAVILELVPREVASALTQKVQIPVIGIGAGPDCDGQVQVFHDLLGLYKDFTPKHSRIYANIGDQITKSLGSYVADVISGDFPDDEESFHIEPGVLSDVFE